MTHPQHPPCAHLRELVKDCLSKHMYESASFFADKLVTLSGHAPADVWLLAQAFYVNKQYHRCLLLLKQSGLVDQDVRCRYLAARCLIACEEWDECLQLLGEDGDGTDAMTTDKTMAPHSALGMEVHEAAAQHLLRGRVYQALDNTTAAIKSFKAALVADPYCYEAFQALADHHYLTNEEELTLIDTLHVRPEDTWLTLLYRCRAKKYQQGNTMEAQLMALQGGGGGERGGHVSGYVSGHVSGHVSASASAQGSGLQFESMMMQHEVATPATGVRTRAMTRHRSDASTISPTPPTPSGADPPHPHPHPHPGGPLPPTNDVSTSLDVMACRADWLYHQGLYQECFALTSSMLARDPYATEHLPLHLAAALELKQKNELFLRAHKLVSNYPDKAVSWFAVGCYYMATGQYASASRYFGKATAADPRFAAGWVGYGHAFAAQDESDKAMAAYRRASRSFPGLHAPLLGMGIEYARMNNTNLAESLVLQAHRMCSADPLTLHEMGVLAYKQGRMEEAVERFHTALQLVPAATRHLPVWEATMTNLGHAYRRQGQYGRAIEWLNHALALCPHQSGALAALGLTYHLQGDLYKAIEHYHKALGLRPEDTLTTDLLTMAVNGLEAAEASAMAAADDISVPLDMSVIHEGGDDME